MGHGEENERLALERSRRARGGHRATELLVWQSGKHGVVDAHVSGDSAVIEYAARDENNNLAPPSMTLRGSKRGRLVAHTPMLDAALQRSVQTRVQVAIEPLATKPAIEAVRQGYAAPGLQSNYLQRELAAEARAKRGTTGP